METNEGMIMGTKYKNNKSVYVGNEGGFAQGLVMETKKNKPTPSQCLLVIRVVSFRKGMVTETTHTHTLSLSLVEAFRAQLKRTQS